jgi:AcrR family transcriptional regulator
MGKLTINKQKKKDSILNTAFELFTTKGIVKTSISDIADSAGVAKGTFYLYFKDKYDLKNKLVSYKSSQLFKTAVTNMEKQNLSNLEDKIIFIVDDIINQLKSNKILLSFIAKNLSWGIFKNVITADTEADNEDNSFREIYYKMLSEENFEIEEPEIMLFLIVELVSSTCYSAILYNEPTEFEKIKPFLYNSIRSIIWNHKNK